MTAWHSLTVFLALALLGAAQPLRPIDSTDPAKYLPVLKAIKYEGVIGPVSFDKYGDITGPFRLWRIQDGKVTTTGEMSAAEVDKIRAELAK